MADPSPPIPDPTILTTEQLLRAVRSERDYVDGKIGILIERFNGIDKATELLSETVHRVPTEVQETVGHLESLMLEKFGSVATQFAERDVRQERESKDNTKAVDAAFAASKEAAAKQDEANQKAISKSEIATERTIEKLSELFKTTTDGLREQLGDLKLTVTGVIQSKAGVNEAVSAGRETAAAQRAWMAFGISVVLLLLTVVGFIISLNVKK